VGQQQQARKGCVVKAANPSFNETTVHKYAQKWNEMHITEHKLQFNQSLRQCVRSTLGWTNMTRTVNQNLKFNIQIS